MPTFNCVAGIICLIIPFSVYLPLLGFAMLYPTYEFFKKSSRGAWSIFCGNKLRPILVFFAKLSFFQKKAEGLFHVLVFF